MPLDRFKIWIGTPRPLTLALAVLAPALLPAPATAETCFRQCLASRVTSSEATDDQIRFEMKGCRDRCEAEVKAEAERRGLTKALAACKPEPVSIEEFRAIRGASPSYVVQSNAFTWDLKNPLPDKIVREVEIVTQTMSLADTEMTAPATVLPGEQSTALVAGFFDGYPNARYATRVKAIWACPIR